MYVFVEGPDDVDFVNGVLRPELEKRFDYVEPVEYQKKSFETRRRFVNSIDSMADSEYVYLCDHDGHGKTGARGKSHICISSKKDKLVKAIPNIMQNRVFVVGDCIESWYLAGANAKTLRTLKLKKIRDTQTICKAGFQKMVPRGMSISEFMIKFLENYSIGSARNCNKSFKYFAEKNGIP